MFSFLQQFFETPSLVGGIPLVALPIVLHLIMRRKSRHFEFPALRFIQERYERNRSRLRLRHLLLLLLRVAVIVLLALALARPRLPTSMSFSSMGGGEKAPVAAALIFDTSVRMEYMHQNQTRLEAAQELGLWILGELPEDSQIAVFDTRLGPAAFQIDRDAARHRIERLQTVPNSQPLSSVLDAALDKLGESDLARKEVYVLTDMARISWPKQADGVQRKIAALNDAGIYVIDVGVAEPVNTALGELRLSEQVLSSRTPLKIRTELNHTGPATQRTVELYLLERGPQALAGEPKKQKRSQKIVALEADQSYPVEFPVDVLEVGTHQGIVAIAGRDALACDDRRYFTVEVTPPWRILVAAPDPPDKYAFLLTQAIAPERFRQSGRARFDCDVVPLEEIAALQLEPYAAVCLLDPGPLEPKVWEKLGDYASAGGGVAIFLGRRAGADAQQVKRFNRPEALELLPGPIGFQGRSRDGERLAPESFQHPILATLGSWAGAIPWEQCPVFRWWRLGDLAEGVHVVVPLSQGQPVVLERPMGYGRVVTITTPISDWWQDQPWNRLLAGMGGQSWPAVIMINDLMAYLAGSTDQQLNYFAGQPAVLRLDPTRVFRSYALATPNDLEVRLTPDLDGNKLEITSTEAIGNYRVRAGGATSGVDRGFSVNLRPDQTSMERLPDEDLDEILGPGNYRIARNREDIERDVATGRVGWKLFGLLIVLAAIALGLEHLVANRFYRD